MAEFIRTHPAIFPVYFVCLWIVVSALVSYMTGWAALAKHFRLQGDFNGPRWTWQSGQMRWMTNYNGCLIIGADEYGLFLSIMLLFRVNHPTLLIPWTEITVTSTQKWMVGKCYKLSLGRELGIPLSIRASLGDKLKAASGKHWPMETIS